MKRIIGYFFIVKSSIILSSPCDFSLFSKNTHHQIDRYDVFFKNTSSGAEQRAQWQKNIRAQWFPWIRRHIAVLDQVIIIDGNSKSFHFPSSVNYPADGIYSERKTTFTSPFSHPHLVTKNLSLNHNTTNGTDHFVLIGPEGEHLKAENIQEIQKADLELVDYRKDDLLVLNGPELAAYIRFYDGSPLMRIRSGNDTFHALFFDAKGEMPWEKIFTYRGLSNEGIQEAKLEQPFDRHIEIGRLFTTKDFGQKPQEFLSHTWQHKILDRTFAEENDIQEFSYGPSKKKPKIFFYANTDISMAKYLTRDFGFKVYKAARKKKNPVTASESSWEFFEIKGPKDWDPNGDYVLRASAPDLLKQLEGKLGQHVKLSLKDQHELEEQIKFIKIFLENNSY
jgi:hypothetical protein